MLRAPWFAMICKMKNTFNARTSDDYKSIDRMYRTSYINYEMSFICFGNFCVDS